MKQETRPEQNDECVEFMRHQLSAIAIARSNLIALDGLMSTLSNYNFVKHDMAEAISSLQKATVSLDDMYQCMLHKQ